MFYAVDDNCQDTNKQHIHEDHLIFPGMNQLQIKSLYKRISIFQLYEIKNIYFYCLMDDLNFTIYTYMYKT